MQRFMSIVVAAAGLVLAAVSVIAQPTGTSPLTAPPNGVRRADPRWITIRNCTLHPEPGKTVEHATVLIRDGRIAAIMPGEGDQPARLPVGPRVVDATGKHLYAAFVEPFAEVDAPAPAADAPGRHWNEGVTPERSALDGAGLDAGAAESLRKQGFATAAISPRGGVIRGTSAVVSLAKPLDDRSMPRPEVYRDGVYQTFAFDLGARGYPDSQMGAIALIRQTLLDAQWEGRRRWEGGSFPPSSILRLAPPQTLQGSSESKQPEFVFVVEDELEALRAAKIGKEFGRRLMIVGTGTEFRRLDAIRADNLPFVIPVNYPKAPDVSSPGKAESVELRDLMTWEQAPTNPRRLAAAGVSFSFTTARLRDRGQFLENVRKAVKHGLSADAALAALTTIPAAQLGVSGDVGTIEAGKRANLLLTDGPVLSDAPAADKTRLLSLWIDGQEHRLYEEPQDLAGDWEVEVTGAPEAKRKLAIEGDQITVWYNDKNQKATQVRMEPGRVSFAVDHELLDGQQGVFVFSAAIEHDASGRAIRLTGQGLRAGGAEFAWSATRRPRALEGLWSVQWTTPQGEMASEVLAFDKEGGLKVTASLDSPDSEARELTYDGKSLVFSLDGGAGRGVIAGRYTAELDWKAEPPVMHGNVARESGALALTATRFVVAGAWRVTEQDGQAAGPEDKNAPTIVIEKENVTIKVGETSAKATEEKFEGPRVSYAYDNKPFGAEGVWKDRVWISGDVLVGSSVLPDGKTHAFKAVRQKDDDPAAEQEAIKAIPATFGLPFGPYSLEEMPAQEPVLITNATIWTSGPAGRIENGSILISGGKIVAVGAGDLKVKARPESAPRVIDAQGRHITPGIIDCHSHTGISKGVNEGGQAVTSEVRIEDVTNPDTMNWYWELAGGVTTVNNLHGSANAIGGQSQTNKIRWGAKHPDDMHFEGAKPGIKFALGENPRQANGQGSDRYPQTRMGVETLIRDRFTAAREYQKAWDAFRAGEGKGIPPRQDLELDALSEVLAGKRLVHCHSYRQDEIVMLCQIAEQFGFKIGTFQHILEGYKVADWVRDHTTGGGSGFTDWWAYKVEVQDAIPQGLPLMHDVGNIVSFNSDSDEMARRLNVEAAKAVKYGGLSEEEALKFVTINPARQLMIDSRTGSLEEGKDADLVVWSGPPLSSMSRCDMTFVDGRMLFSRERDQEQRTKASAERARLIQKVLTDGKKSRGDRARGDRAGERAGDRPAPGGGDRPRRRRPPQMDDAQWSAAQRQLEDMWLTGRTTNLPGECGCGFTHE